MTPNTHDDVIAPNRRNWDRRVEPHRRAYPADAFLTWRRALRPPPRSS